MPAPTLEHVKVTALRHLATGQSAREVERIMGDQVTHSTISRLAKKAENRAIIEAEQDRIIAKLKNPVDQTLADIETAAKLAKYWAGEDVPGIEELLTRLGIKSERRIDDNGAVTVITQNDMGPVLKYYETASKRADKVMASVGLLPTGGAPSQFVQNIYNDNRQSVTVNPLVMSALGDFLASKMDAIDLTPQDIDEEPDAAK
jgi:hypothetical protein